MKEKSEVKTTPLKITLTDPELLCLSNIRKAGSFRSDSDTIGETLRFVQALRDDPGTLSVLGSRFGIMDVVVIGKKLYDKLVKVKES